MLGRGDVCCLCCLYRGACAVFIISSDPVMEVMTLITVIILACLGNRDKLHCWS